MNNFSIFKSTNGSNSPFNIFNPTSKVSSACQHNFKCTNQHEECRSEKTSQGLAGTIRTCSGTARTQPLKKFKPNISGPRSRVSFDGAEDSFKNDAQPPRWHNQQPNNSTEKLFPSCESRSNSVSSTSSSEGNIGTDSAQQQQVSEEGEDEGGYPHKGSKDYSFNNSNQGVTNSQNLPNCCNPISQESTTVGSTLTSPTLSSTNSTGIGLLRDLSLGREESADSCEERLQSKEDQIGNNLSGKIREKLASKKQAHSKILNQESEELFEKFKNAAQKLNYECISTKCPSKDSPLTFRCSMKHTITTTEFFKTETLSCPKCAKKMERCQEFAKAHNGLFCSRQNFL